MKRHVAMYNKVTLVPMNLGEGAPVDGCIHSTIEGHKSFEEAVGCLESRARWWLTTVSAWNFQRPNVVSENLCFTYRRPVGAQLAQKQEKY